VAASGLLAGSVAVCLRSDHIAAEETSEASRMVLTGSALYSPPDGIPAGPFAVKLAGSGDRLTSKGSRTAVLMTDGAIRRNSSAWANNLLWCVQKVKYRAGAR
jgi:hypothetical protein